MPEVAIVGAGASGLVASIVLARRGFEVVVFEKNGKIGKKLLATGNGRCNITNKNISISNFHTQNPKFLNHTLSRFNSTACSKFFNELGIDFLSVAGHKIYGPKGIGVLYVREGMKMTPLLHGAGQEGGRRAGTESVILAVGLGEACRVAKKRLKNDMYI